jgi:hypothetical protein
MGADKNIAQAHIISAATASSISRAMRCAVLDNMSFQTVWSGTTPVGTVTIEVSNDHQETGGIVTNAGTWTALTTPAQLAVSGNAGNAVQQVVAGSFAFIRANFAKTSGTFAALDVYFNGRSV